MTHCSFYSHYKLTHMIGTLHPQTACQECVKLHKYLVDLNLLEKCIVIEKQILVKHGELQFKGNISSKEDALFTRFEETTTF